MKVVSPAIISVFTSVPLLVNLKKWSIGPLFLASICFFSSKLLWGTDLVQNHTPFLTWVCPVRVLLVFFHLDVTFRNSPLIKIKNRNDKLAIRNGKCRCGTEPSKQISLLTASYKEKLEHYLFSAFLDLGEND